MSRPFKLPSFWKYLVLNDDGEIQGIAENAPEKEKIKYEEWKKKKQELAEQGWK